MILGFTKNMNEWMASSQPYDYKTRRHHNIRSANKNASYGLLNPAPGQELEMRVILKTGFGRIADTPEDAINCVSELTHDVQALQAMSQRMKTKVDYSTYIMY